MSKFTTALSLASAFTLVLGCNNETVPPAADGGSRDLGSADMTAPTDLGALVDGDGGAIGPWEQYCMVNGPARDTRCGYTPDPVASCRTEAACLISVARADVAGTIPACLAARACGASDDACYTATGAGATPSTAATAFQTACLAKETGCPAGTGFAGDGCFADIVTDPMIAELMTCLESACGAVDDCFQAIWDVRAPGCF